MYLVQEVRALTELRSEGVVAPVHSEVHCEGLGQEVVFLRDVIEHIVGLDGCLHVPPQDLQPGPEGQQRVHVGPGHPRGSVHAHVHQHRTVGDVLLDSSIVLQDTMGDHRQP